ncbi:MAG: M48 family metalloprotease [Candidatus Jordarchaeum sp.]|uniref:M48 family metalloprotease n=1 Tax=Candidatus Jordarchaeum sp. TaxID=2823881 RepID=UPI00404A3422
MSEQLERIEGSSVHEPVIQNIIDDHLEKTNCQWKLVSGKRFPAESNDPPAFSRGIYICNIPLGVIYISDQLYGKLNSEELQYIVLHEICHILYNDSAANFLFEWGKSGFSHLFSKWTNLELYAVEDILGGVKAVLKTFGYPGVEEQVRRNQELNADKYAVIWMGKKDPAIGALTKLVEGKVESLSHITRYGKFEFPALTINERIQYLKQIKI